MLAICVATKVTADGEAHRLLTADSALMAEDRVAAPALFNRSASEAIGLTAPIEARTDTGWVSIGRVTFTIPVLVALAPSGGTVFGVAPDTPAPLRGADSNGNCPRSDAGRRWVAANRLEFAVAAAPHGAAHGDQFRVKWHGRWLTTTARPQSVVSSLAVYVVEFDDGEDQCDEKFETPPSPASPVRLTADGGRCFVLVDSPSSSATTSGLRAASCRATGAPTDAEVGPNLTSNDAGASVWIEPDRTPRLAGWLLTPSPSSGWMKVTPYSDVLPALTRVAADLSRSSVTNP
jgi:hypothetical protein